MKNENAKSLGLSLGNLNCSRCYGEKVASPSWKPRKPWACPLLYHCPDPPQPIGQEGVAAKSKERPAKYSALLTQEDVQASDLDLLVERVSNGQVTPLVAHLVNRDSISREEIDELKRLVTDAEKR